MAVHILTSDRMPFLALFLGFPAALLVMFGGFVVAGVIGTYQSLGNGAPETAIRCDSVYPPVCSEYSVRDEAQQRLLIACAMIIAGMLLWPVGFRHRYVVLDGATVRVMWGERCALPLHTYPTQDISRIAITKEARFTVVPTGSITRVYRVPDRWRLRAMFRGRSINLGSYETEFLAQAAAEHIKATQHTDDDGIYHYGRT